VRLLNVCTAFEILPDKRAQMSVVCFQKCNSKETLSQEMTLSSEHLSTRALLSLSIDFIENNLHKTIEKEFHTLKTNPSL